MLKSEDATSPLFSTFKTSLKFSERENALVFERSVATAKYLPNEISITSSSRVVLKTTFPEIVSTIALETFKVSFPQTALKVSSEQDLRKVKLKEFEIEAFFTVATIDLSLRL